ncbi:Hsp20 family protein [Puniceicoccales bacterium CK1056]|uniref:Hsp20 family protein n=1 Tax=Oceanipulchritudo coccoides TaxID=2706888 RepID=A0A6B2M4G4_9BACT|nr:Hsp20/alpha crystallin family protein [Oceanipulchritudo coccoides]NDV62977.1 Hsp20 family protein [Oceanipulchritudo coccoides]
MKLIKHDSFFSDPWTDLDRLLESTLPELYQWNPMRLSGRERSLPVDVFEDEHNRTIRLEIPGVAKKDIELELENAVLSVRAKRIEKTESGETTINLNRSVTVGDDVEADKIKASLENGMLTIVLPKREQAKPKQITIA